MMAGILLFLGTALLLYVILGGADFGAGILELVMRKDAGLEDRRRLISRAMAPVWEANHVWLILVVVILFMGFPTIYTTLATYLHLPLLMVLAGITARGCAFTFRHYDTLDRRYYRSYSGVFAFSSLWTSIFLGVTAGALSLGRIETSASVSFHAAYIAPWLNFFCFSVGLFTSCLFAMLAAIFLVGEAETPELKRYFVKRSAAFCGALLLSGGLVFASAEAEGLPLLREFFTDPLSIACFALATLLLVPFWWSLVSLARALWVRLTGAAIVALVLLGWYAVQYPAAVRMTEHGMPRSLSFAEAAAPDATLKALLYALIGGSFVIFPTLGYLFRIFKRQIFERDR
jgi:cytochrome d ubiquinol oxidase subunit II